MRDPASEHTVDVTTGADACPRNSRPPVQGCSQELSSTPFPRSWRSCRSARGCHTEGWQPTPHGARELSPPGSGSNSRGQRGEVSSTARAVAKGTLLSILTLRRNIAAQMVLRCRLQCPCEPTSFSLDRPTSAIRAPFSAIVHGSCAGCHPAPRGLRRPQPGQLITVSAGAWCSGRREHSNAPIRSRS